MFKTYYKFCATPKLKYLRQISYMSIPLSNVDKILQDEKIMEPYQHISRVHSKHHKKVCLAFNHWLNVSRNREQEIGDILQTFHTASLLLDDIQDDSESRYGLIAAHRVFGVPLTVNAASTAMGIAFRKTQELGHPSAVNIFLDGYLDTHRGQGIDLYWTKNFICPTKEEHFAMLKEKAASFFIMAVKLLQLFSNTKEDYSQLAMLIGIYYPLLDDYYNLFHSEALMSLTTNDVLQVSSINNVCNDITEGKFTLPIIHALQNPNISSQVCDILKQRTSDPHLKEHCLSLLKKNGSDAYMRHVLCELEDNIRSEINQFGGNPALTNVMDELSIQKSNRR